MLKKWRRVNKANKIVEKLVDKCEKCQLKQCINCQINYTQITAIKEVIEDWKNSVEQLLEDYNDVGKEMFKYSEECEKKDKVIDELKEEIQSLRFLVNSVFDNGYIHKSKIKEKIEEVNKSLGYSPVNKILIEQVLQELIKEAQWKSLE